MNTELLPSSKIRWKGDLLCQPTRFTYRLAAYQDMGQSIVYTTNACLCGEIMSLKNVHHKLGPKPDQASLQLVKLYLSQMTRLNRPKRTWPMTRVQVVNCYEGSKRAEYERARICLEVEGYDHKFHSMAKMFLKDDKYPSGDINHIGSLHKDMKAGRAIQYRSKEYGIELARFLKPIEHAIYQWKVCGHRMIAKSRNSYERAADLFGMWNHFTDPMALLLDHSKFDAHVSTSLLNFEAAVYHKYNSSGKFRMLMRAQLFNKGRTSRGLRYSVVGTRFSGDMNTGLGNSVINIGIIGAYMTACGIKEFLQYVDGDDSVVCFNRGDEHKLLPLSWFNKVGMETKCDRVYNFADVEFCNSKCILIGDRYRYVRDITRTIQRATWSVRNFGPKLKRRLINSLGQCELALNDGVPILQAFAECLIAVSGTKHCVAKLENYHQARLEGTLFKAVAKPIGPDVRLMFEQSYGISPEMQILVENMMKSMVVTGVTDTDFAYAIEAVRGLGKSL